MATSKEEVLENARTYFQNLFKEKENGQVMNINNKCNPAKMPKHRTDRALKKVSQKTVFKVITRLKNG